MRNNNAEAKVTYHYAYRSPFLFLEVMAPLPALTWMLRYPSPNGDVNALSMPKIAEDGGNRPEGHHIHNVENQII